MQYGTNFAVKDPFEYLEGLGNYHKLVNGLCKFFVSRY